MDTHELDYYLGLKITGPTPKSTERLLKQTEARYEQGETRLTKYQTDLWFSLYSDRNRAGKNTGDLMCPICLSYVGRPRQFEKRIDQLLQKILEKESTNAETPIKQ